MCRFKQILNFARETNLRNVFPHVFGVGNDTRLGERRFEKLLEKNGGRLVLKEAEWEQFFLFWTADASLGEATHSIIGVLTVTTLVSQKFAVRKCGRAGMEAWPRLFVAELEEQYEEKKAAAVAEGRNAPRRPKKRFGVAGHLHVLASPVTVRATMEHSTGGQKLFSLYGQDIHIRVCVYIYMFIYIYIYIYTHTHTHTNDRC